MKLYIDSNIIISYLKSEFGGVTKAQSIRVKDFLSNSSMKKFTFIFSDLTYFEIKKIAYFSEQEVNGLMKKFKINIEEVKTDKETFEKAEKVKQEIKIHYPDNIHVALALKSKANAIITWNLKDFLKAKKLIKVLTPSDLN